MQINDAFQQLENRKVYEVLYKDSFGNFQPFLRKNPYEKIIKGDDFDRMLEDDSDEKDQDEESKQKKFLIYIINQEIEFDEQPVTITFFKDITFGILYDQMLAQDDLQNIIKNNLDKKIGKRVTYIS
jgi:predicted nucleotidyltransferase